MNRKLQLLFTALLLAMGVTSAWADAYDGSSAIYNQTQGKNYSSLATAVSEAAASDVIVLHADFADRQ